MKKITLLITLFALGSIANAAVSISGTALQNPLAAAGSAYLDPAGGDVANYVDATNIATWGATAAAFTSFVLSSDYTDATEGSTSVQSVFGSTSVGGVSNVNLDSTPFAIIIEGAAEGTYSLYTNSPSWVGPATGGTLSVARLSDTNAIYTVVPEPSTYALLAGFAAFLFVAIRRRK